MQANDGTALSANQVIHGHPYGPAVSGGLTDDELGAFLRKEGFQAVQFDMADSDQTHLDATFIATNYSVHAYEVLMGPTGRPNT